MGGYVGKIAVIDLTDRKLELRNLNNETFRQWIGGSGLGVKLWLDEADPGVEPLSPGNPLIFMTGPMTGTIIPASGRHQVVTKSPLTGIYGEADAGGKWGTFLKRAGFDGLIIKGAADRPVYLYIHNGIVDILDAAKVWGLDTYQTDLYMKEKHGQDIAVSCIGPAGEKKVRIATILHEGKVGRSSGRGGLGAVMGAKGLKAIVVAGDGLIPVADYITLKAKIDAVIPAIEERTQGMQQYGTAGGLIGSERIGDLPVKNWSGGSWPQVEHISGQTMAESIVSGRYHCQSCPIGCGREVRISSSPYGRVEGAGPEYETLGMFGGACLIADLPAIALANELCNRYGIDTISAGAAVAFAMELYEKGLLKDDDYIEPGMKPEFKLIWGDGKALIGLIHQIGRRQGLGELLGCGVRHAAEVIGPQAREYAIHVKGLELPAHDPRAFYSLGLGYATSNRGACHLQGGSYFFEKAAVLPEIGITEVLDRFREENHGKIQARLQDTMCLMDSLKLCKFLFYGGITLTTIAGWLNALTGWDMTVEELLTAGERIFTMKRVFNVRCGVTRSDDTLPERILKLPRPDGGAADSLPPLDKMLDEYYQARGWDETGCPTPKTLARLGLGGKL